MIFWASTLIFQIWRCSCLIKLGCIAFISLQSQWGPVPILDQTKWDIQCRKLAETRFSVQWEFLNQVKSLFQHQLSTKRLSRLILVSWHKIGISIIDFLSIVVASYPAKILLFIFFGSRDSVDFNCWSTTGVITYATTVSLATSISPLSLGLIFFWLALIWLTLTWLTTSIIQKILVWLTFLHILGSFFTIGQPLASKTGGIDLSYSWKVLAVDFELGVHDFFNDFVPIFKIAIFFIKLGLYQRSEVILEISNKYILVGTSDKIELFQNSL